jgi:lysozyme family protein
MEKKMNKFRQWYLTNQTEITWFLIGFLVYAGLQDLNIGNYVGALVSFGLAWINYALNK